MDSIASTITYQQILIAPKFIQIRDAYFVFKSVARKVDSNHWTIKSLQVWSPHPEPARIIHADEIISCSFHIYTMRENRELCYGRALIFCAES